MRANTMRMRRIAAALLTLALPLVCAACAGTPSDANATDSVAASAAATAMASANTPGPTETSADTPGPVDTAPAGTGDGPIGVPDEREMPAYDGLDWDGASPGPIYDDADGVLVVEPKTGTLIWLPSMFVGWALRTFDMRTNGPDMLAHEICVYRDPDDPASDTTRVTWGVDDVRGPYKTMRDMVEMKIDNALEGYEILSYDRSGCVIYEPSTPAHPFAYYQILVLLDDDTYLWIYFDTWLPEHREVFESIRFAYGAFADRLEGTPNRREDPDVMPVDVLWGTWVSENGYAMTFDAQGTYRLVDGADQTIDEGAYRFEPFVTFSIRLLGRETEIHYRPDAQTIALEDADRKLDELFFRQGEHPLGM